MKRIYYKPSTTIISVNIEHECLTGSDLKTANYHKLSDGDDPTTYIGIGFGGDAPAGINPAKGYDSWSLWED